MHRIATIALCLSLAASAHAEPKHHTAPSNRRPTPAELERFEACVDDHVGDLDEDEAAELCEDQLDTPTEPRTRPGAKPSMRPVGTPTLHSQPDDVCSQW